MHAVGGVALVKLTNAPAKFQTKGETKMRLSIKGIAIASGLLWGSAILFVGLINLAKPTYGMTFLTMMTSVYPWFHSSHTVTSVVIGAVDGVIDGIIAGCLFGWLYNTMLDLSNKAHTLQRRQT
jgi:hypothetical protein